MPSLELKTRRRLVDGLGVVFYVAMAAALLTVMMGSPGWAFLMLVLGSAGLVVRTTLELRFGALGRGSGDRFSE